MLYCQDLEQTIFVNKTAREALIKRCLCFLFFARGHGDVGHWINRGSVVQKCGRLDAWYHPYVLSEPTMQGELVSKDTGEREQRLFNVGLMNLYPANHYASASHIRLRIACYRLSVSGGERRRTSEGNRVGILFAIRFVTSSPSFAFTIREPGAGWPGR